MIVSHKYRFIFLRTEKTGGSSFTQALQNLLEEGDLQADMRRPAWAKFSPIHHGALKLHLPKYFGLHRHARARDVRDVVGAKIFNSYYKFAIERNPWDRQVSLYAHRAWKKGKPPENFDRDMRSMLYRGTEYVRLNNWAIYAIGDGIVADRVLRYERLDEEINALVAELGLPAMPEMPRLRSYAPDRPHYSTFYSDATRNMVGRWYSKEIAALGYRFETADDGAGQLRSEAGADQVTPIYAGTGAGQLSGVVEKAAAGP